MKLTQADIRCAIETQVCPWCQAGPFKLLSAHTAKIHGVGANSMRVLGGLTAYAPTASADTRQRNAAASARTRNLANQAVGGQQTVIHRSVLVTLARMAVSSARSGMAVDRVTVEDALKLLGPVDLERLE